MREYMLKIQELEKAEADLREAALRFGRDASNEGLAVLATAARRFADLAAREEPWEQGGAA